MANIYSKLVKEAAESKIRLGEYSTGNAPSKDASSSDVAKRVSQGQAASGTARTFPNPQ